MAELSIDFHCQNHFRLSDIKCPETKYQVTPLEACQDPNCFVRLLMDNADLKGIIPITLKCKARWVLLEPHGVTSLSTGRKEFQWRESLLTHLQGNSETNPLKPISLPILSKLRLVSLQNANQTLCKQMPV